MMLLIALILPLVVPNINGATEEPLEPATMPPEVAERGVYYYIYDTAQRVYGFNFVEVKGYQELVNLDLKPQQRKVQRMINNIATKDHMTFGRCNVVDQAKQFMIRTINDINQRLDEMDTETNETKKAEMRERIKIQFDIELINSIPSQFMLVSVPFMKMSVEAILIADARLAIQKYYDICMNLGNNPPDNIQKKCNRILKLYKKYEKVLKRQYAEDYESSDYYAQKKFYKKLYKKLYNKDVPMPSIWANQLDMYVADEERRKNLQSYAKNIEELNKEREDEEEYY